MDDNLGVRLKIFKEKSKLPMAAIAQATDISIENLYKWASKGTNPTDIKSYRRLEKYLDENEFLVGIVRDPKNQYKTKLSKSTSLQHISIQIHTHEEPELYEGESSPGSLITIKGKPSFIAYQPDSAIHGRAECVIRITFSLAPKYNYNKDGMWIGLRRLKPEEARNASNYYYIIDSDNKVYITKYIPSGQKNSVVLHPLNENVAPFLKQNKDIQLILKIEWFQESFASDEIK